MSPDQTDVALQCTAITITSMTNTYFGHGIVETDTVDQNFDPDLDNKGSSSLEDT